MHQTRTAPAVDHRNSGIGQCLRGIEILAGSGQFGAERLRTVYPIHHHLNFYAPLAVRHQGIHKAGQVEIKTGYVDGTFGIVDICHYALVDSIPDIIRRVRVGEKNLQPTGCQVAGLTVAGCGQAGCGQAGCGQAGCGQAGYRGSQLRLRGSRCEGRTHARNRNECKHQNYPAQPESVFIPPL